MPSVRRDITTLTGVCGMLIVAACQPPRPVPPEPRADPCVIINDEPSDIVVAVAAPVTAAGAPVPATDAEQLVFAQLYDTLVHVDCTGVVVPALATAWSDSAGIVWRFMLRVERSFSDGAPIHAAAVMQSWSSSSVRTAFTGLSVTGSRELRAELREPVSPEFFGHPALAVGGRSHSGWPATSTGWHVAPETDVPALTTEVAAGRSLTFRVYAHDIRAAIDDAADLIVSGDGVLADHAEARGGYTATPLPWTRTYVVATASRGERTLVGDEVATALARAVRASVRPAHQPFWWDGAPCGVPGVPFRAAREARDIVYLRGDRVAQSLAERIAAQAWPAASAPPWLRAVLPAGYGAAGPPRAVPLDEPALLQALRARLPLAVVAALPRMPDPACASGSRVPVSELLGNGWQLTPLLDARDMLLHRAGAGRVTADAFGSVRILAQ
jgi:hypothetical protein